MKTVLFAIDHMDPDRTSLDYALKLCRRMSAGLEVLHIVRPPRSPGSPANHRRGRVGKVREVFERAMVSVTFAEAGVPDPLAALKMAAHSRFKRLLPERSEVRITYGCMVTDDPPAAVIERYVRNRRQIVLTVLDPRSRRGVTDARGRRKPPAGNTLMPKLSVPLVLVKNAH
jgi:hypothetical protein